MSAAERDQDRNLLLGYGNDRPEIVWFECDGCGQQAMCALGYSCPNWCQGNCGTDGCVGVDVFCAACMPGRHEAGLPETGGGLTRPYKKPQERQDGIPAPPWAAGPADDGEVAQ